MNINLYNPTVKKMLSILLIAFLSSLIAFKLSQVNWIKLTDFKFMEYIIENTKQDTTDNIILINITKDCKSRLKYPSNQQFRKYHISILNKLKDAKVIAFGVFFRYPSIYDKYLANKMAKLNKIVIATHDGYNTQDCFLTSAYPGYTDFHHDKDGIVRRFRPLIKDNNKVIVENGKINYLYKPSFAFSVAQLFYGENYSKENKEYIIGINEDDESIKMALGKIRKDENGMIFVRDAKNKFTEYSYFEVYSSKERNSIFNDKIVIIGDTDSDGDIHYTPFGKKYGLYLNALAINTILCSDYILHISGIKYIVLLLVISYSSSLFYIRFHLYSILLFCLFIITSVLMAKYLLLIVQIIPIICMALFNTIVLIVYLKVNKGININNINNYIDVMGLLIILLLVLMMGGSNGLTSVFYSIAATMLLKLIISIKERKANDKKK